MYQIYLESKIRWYNFDLSKIESNTEQWIINVTKWQINYEFKHLLNKLQLRDPDRYNKYLNEKNIEVNSIFKIINWDIEEWEKIN